MQQPAIGSHAESYEPNQSRWKSRREIHFQTTRLSFKPGTRVTTYQAWIVSIPSMWSDYDRFVTLRRDATTSGILDMGDVSWVYPTTLLPLAGFLLTTHRRLQYKPPQEKGVADYIRLMMSGSSRRKLTGKSYVPSYLLPEKQADASMVFERIMKLQDDGRGVGGRTAFAYLVGELMANIYEHSGFENAIVMAQKYRKKGFVEVSFFDDGITIPGSLRKAGYCYPTDLEAIKDAVNGQSSKASCERGYGLGTNVKMCTDVGGLGGKVLVVSGRGAFEYSSRKSEQCLYNLGESSYSLDGSLISIRIPYPSQEVSIYDFTQ